MSLTIDRLPTSASSPETIVTERPSAVASEEPLPFAVGAVDLSIETTRSSPEEMTTLAAMNRMAVSIDTPLGTETYFEAADPGYKRFFSRDSLKTAAFAESTEMLVSQLDFSARRIGKTHNPLTGEEPGKPPHEWPAPGEAIEPFRAGRFTTYNACDTGAILLQSIAMLVERGYPGIADQYKETIEQTVAYIKRHINRQGLFIEDPAFSGSTEPSGRDRKFALRVTNWKDSVINKKGQQEPNYPIVYTIAHFQNAQALQRLGHATGDNRLIRTGHHMTEQGLAHLWRDDHFVSAIDGGGDIDPPSTDSLESLLYIPPRQMPTGYAQRIENYTAQLETDAGYRAGIPEDPNMEDQYHMKVWVHSQAELHAAARLHGLSTAQNITKRIREYIDRDKGLYPEILDPETYRSCGNDKQLWVMGADLYFMNPSESFLSWESPRLRSDREANNTTTKGLASAKSRLAEKNRPTRAGDREVHDLARVSLMR